MSSELRIRQLAPRAALLIVIVLATACSKSGGGQQQGRGRGQRTGPAEVGVIAAKAGTITITTELPGRTAAFETSDVRPQVSGIVRRRLFTEGSLVHEGQALYEIEPDLYRAAVGQAAAQVQSAEANLTAAQLQAQRYTGLVGIQAVSKQEADNAVAAAGQARASVAQYKAAQQTAQINLRYTVVRAPITGRIGRSDFTAGALVTASQATALATIQRLDPMFVDIQQSASALLALRREIAGGGALPASTQVRLKLDDGSDYGQTGTLEFTEVTVDQSTGAVTLRARFPNGDRTLLPGMFVRAVVPERVEPNAILVPQPGVSRNSRGDAVVLVVGAGNKVEQKTVKTDGVYQNQWIVTGGLNIGDRIIVEGTSGARVGQAVKPVAASTVVGGTAPPPVAKAPQGKGKNAAAGTPATGAGQSSR